MATNFGYPWGIQLFYLAIILMLTLRIIKLCWTGQLLDPEEPGTEFYLAGCIGWLIGPQTSVDPKNFGHFWSVPDWFLADFSLCYLETLVSEVVDMTLQRQPCKMFNTALQSPISTCTATTLSINLQCCCPEDRLLLLRLLLFLLIPLVLLLILWIVSRPVC